MSNPFWCAARAANSAAGLSALHAAGAPVRAFVRPRTDAAPLRELGAELIEGCGIARRTWRDPLIRFAGAELPLL
jgi:hypothetical protein